MLFGKFTVKKKNLIGKLTSNLQQAMDEDQYVGVIICKLDRHKDRLRGYIAMLAVAKTHRKMSIGSNLVKMAIRAMKEMNADEASVPV